MQVHAVSNDPNAIDRTVANAILRTTKSPIGTLGLAIKDHAITADRFVSVMVDHRKNRGTITYLRSLEAAESVWLEAAESPMITSVIPAGRLLFFEANTTKIVAHRRNLWQVLDTLDSVRDRTGTEGVPLYLAAASPHRAREQYVRTDHRTDPIPGITSIRYVPNEKRIYGIRLNEKRIGKQVVCMELARAEEYPEALFDQGEWKPVATFRDPGIMSFSNPFLTADGLSFIVNLAGANARILTISQVGGGEPRVDWSDEIKTVGTVLCAPAATKGMLVFVENGPKEETEIRLHRYTKADRATDPFARFVI